MNSDDLNLFARVARSGSLSRVALDTGLNQSTVSRHIATLEAELGVRLFRRSGRGVALTERGEILMRYAETVKHSIDEVSRTLRNSSELGPTRLCIAAQPTIARIMFGTLAHALSDRYPNTKIRFVEGLASQLLSALSNGEIDVAVMYLPEERGALQYDRLLTEDVCLITPPDHPLKGDRIDVRVLNGLPLILPSTHHGLRRLVESLAAPHGFSPTIAFECDGSISITKRLVLAHCGCTVLPEAAVVEEVAAGRLKRFRLDQPQVSRDVGIVLPSNGAAAGTVWEASHIIRRAAAELVGSGAWPNARLSEAIKAV
ncbi:LysR family transcriptional regulator [Robbsia sp. KACC 23696]|uniref:LysR family transcriptional regulator n=1 Tax=Robbsia sp. KACC 23696 TaxID=3149231 RepID=UPI00325AF127